MRLKLIHRKKNLISAPPLRCFLHPSWTPQEPKVDFHSSEKTQVPQKGADVPGESSISIRRSLTGAQVFLGCSSLSSVQSPCGFSLKYFLLTDHLLSGSSQSWKVSELLSTSINTVCHTMMSRTLENFLVSCSRKASTNPGWATASSPLSSSWNKWKPPQVLASSDRSWDPALSGPCKSCDLFPAVAKMCLLGCTHCCLS